MDTSTPVCYTREKHENTFQGQFSVFEEVEVTRLLSHFLGAFSQALRILPGLILELCCDTLDLPYKCGNYADLQSIPELIKSIKKIKIR